MNQQIKIAELARIAEQIAPMCDGDEPLLQDMLEGETDLIPLVTRMHEQVARDTEMLSGIKERADSIRERKARIENRRDAFKAAIGKVMRAVHLSKIELPEVTYSVRTGNPKLVVTDKLAVPLDLCETKAEPSAAKIKEAFESADGLPNWLVREPVTDIVTARTK
jgi:hypothetical protein